MCTNYRPTAIEAFRTGAIDDILETKIQFKPEVFQKQGSGLSLLHLMFMLFLIFLRNMIIKDLTPYVVVAHLSTHSQFARLEAPVFGWNPASMRVLEKAGFVREGVLKRSVFKDVQLIDSVLFALILRDA